MYKKIIKALLTHKRDLIPMFIWTCLIICVIGVVYIFKRDKHEDDLRKIL